MGCITIGIDFLSRGFLFRALLIGFSVTIDPLCEIKNQRGRPVELYVHFSTIYSLFSAEISHRLRFLSQEIAAKNERWVGSPLIKSGAEIGSQTPPFFRKSAPWDLQMALFCFPLIPPQFDVCAKNDPAGDSPRRAFLRVLCGVSGSSFRRNSPFRIGGDLLVSANSNHVLGTLCAVFDT